MLLDRSSMQGEPFLWVTMTDTSKGRNSVFGLSIIVIHRLSRLSLGSF